MDLGPPRLVEGWGFCALVESAIECSSKIDTIALPEGVANLLALLSFETHRRMRLLPYTEI